MYAYQKKIDRKKVVALMSVIVLMVSLLMLTQWYLRSPKETLPVIKESELVIALPEKEEKAVLPFDVEASVAIEYFDGNDHEVKDYTNLAGVYRPNQGIDYTFNGEPFGVKAMLSGKVSEVKNDELFGNSVTITSDDIQIVYQSLDGLHFKVGDAIKQNDEIGQASLNVYNPELNNHLHIVVMKNNKIIDPKTVIAKRITEIK